MTKQLKVFFILIIMLILGALYIVTYLCKDSRCFIPAKSLKDIHIGVVQSTQDANLAYISFYDRTLNFLYEKKMNYGDMGDETRVPYLENNNVYTVPLGLGNQKNLKTIIKFDLLTGKYKTFKISEPAVLMFTVYKNNVYTTNTINFYGHITKCDTVTGKLKEWKKRGVIISGLKCYDDVLYCWGSIEKNNFNCPYLFVFRAKSLKLMKQIPLTGCGTQQLDSCKIGNSIYFTNNVGSDGNSTSNILSRYDIETDKIENINLDEPYPFQIIKYKNKLYITHCNPLSGNDNKITIYDLKTGKQQLITMKNALVQTIRYRDCLYSQDMENLYVYDINTLKLLKAIHIDKNRKQLGMKFYIGGFFIK